MTYTQYKIHDFPYVSTTVTVRREISPKLVYPCYVTFSK